LCRDEGYLVRECGSGDEGVQWLKALVAMLEQQLYAA